MTFYIKKTYIDTEPGIELVNIHYTWTPVSEMPNWEAHRETRALPRGGVGGMCIFWSSYDWDAPQYQPTEESTFIARFGEDNPYRSHKFYGVEDKETFSRIRSEMLASLPLPRRFIGKIYGPKGAQVHQRWHVGNLWQPSRADRWEDYWGYVVHTL